MSRKVLIVDNFDSFTYNLAQLVAEIAGEWPRVVRNDHPLEELLDWAPDRVILSPGPGSPSVAADVGGCVALIRRLTETPILGVCLGHQAIAATLGAAIVPAARPMHGKTSRLRHDGTGPLVDLPQGIEVVRYHSLVVAPATLPPELRATGWAEDGTLMALAHRTRPLWGVQFHPESILTEHGRTLMATFLGPGRAASTHAAMQQGRSSIVAGEQAWGRDRLRELPGWIDPLVAFHALTDARPGAWWLDGEGAGRFSCMGLGGPEVVRVHGRRVEVERRGEIERLEGDPFQLVGEIVRRSAVPPGGDFPFTSGYVGCLGYELRRAICPPGQQGEPRAATESAWPDALLLRAERALLFDHQRRSLTLSCHLPAGSDERAGDEAERWFAETAARLAQAGPPPPLRPVDDVAPRFRLDRDEARYRQDIERALDLIGRGESYELCLTTQVRTRTPVDPLDLYRVLRETNPAPYGALLRFPEGWVLSSSPERFIRVDADGEVESRPIKGTRRRGATAERDRLAIEELAGAAKDRAENLMIVDLVRSDLGSVAAIGSVRVPQLMVVETHPTVHQLVSSVRGRLAAGVAPLDAVRALFPAGSMTGAPKLRSMRLLDEIEGAPRGLYAGGLGYLAASGAVDLAMTIRTLLVTGDAVCFGVGGAIVADSDPAAEIDEIFAKGYALMRAVVLAHTGRFRDLDLIIE